MNRRHTIAYQHPNTGLAGLVILLRESEIAAEEAKLIARGYVVTNISRPIETWPESPNAGEPKN
jgi:hypothetical protein